VFGKDPREDEIAWLRQQVDFLQKQLACIADEKAAARLAPPAERRELTGKPRGNWRFRVDKPTQTSDAAAAAGHEAAQRVEAAFDSRQP
jgi:hypothetical protein